MVGCRRQRELRDHLVGVEVGLGVEGRVWVGVELTLMVGDGWGWGQGSGCILALVG